MTMIALEPRVDRLEYLMADLTENVTRLSIEMRAFKEEMREFKDEMAEFKDESRRQTRDMNRKWGELANKMGTLAEDLVAPSIPRILAEYIGCPESGIEFLTGSSSRKRAGCLNHEFDVLAGCGDVLLINDTKSPRNPADVHNFVTLLR